jgi:hypothetical protein
MPKVIMAPPLPVPQTLLLVWYLGIEIIEELKVRDTRMVIMTAPLPVLWALPLIWYLGIEIIEEL